jgi:microcystin-dependent protein
VATPYIGQIILVGFDFAPSGWALCHGQSLPISGNEALFSLIGTTFGGDGVSTFALPDLRGRVPIGMGTGVGLQTHVLGDTGGSEGVTLVTSQLPQHTHAIDVSALTATRHCRNNAGNQVTPVGAVPAVESSAPFVDSPLAAGVTEVRAVHITELRDRVQALRTRVALGAYSWTDATLPSGTAVIRAEHVSDLRAALTQACAAGGLPLPVFAEPIVAGTVIKAAHVTELRNAVLATPAGVTATYAGAVPDASMHAGSIAPAGGVTAASAGGDQPHANMQAYLSLSYCIAIDGLYPSPG